MKLSVLLVLVTSFQVGARPNSADGQTVTLDVSNVSLRSVFSSITEQTGYHFIYTSNQLDKAVPVTLQVRNMSLSEVLEKCFREQPKLSYKVDGEVKEVIVAEKEGRSVLMGEGVEAQPQPTGSNVVTVKGVIQSETGEPLEGASVMVIGSKKGTVTDKKGGFTLENVPADAVLRVSYSGYLAKEISVKGNNSLQIILALAMGVLDQVQVIAYGNTSQRFSTGDVSTVTSADISKQPINNPLLALEGMVPGLFITQNTGLPGSGVIAQIQGQNSISNGNDPFYVVDGVPYTSELLPNFAGMLGPSGINAGNAGGGSPLSFINPDDIESISILKDADATAIYGSRAANGAILITTKKGSPGKTMVNIDVQQGIGQDERKLDLMNTSQYLEMRHEGLNNDGIAPSLANGDYDLLLWDTTRNTDWLKTLMGGTAHYTNINSSVSGGNTNTQFLVGATYHRETTVFPGDFSDQKGSVHFNLNNLSENRKFRIQLTGSFMLDDNQLPSTDLTGTAVIMPPDAPPLYNKDGTLNWAPDATGASTWPGGGNPIAYLFQTYTNKTNNFIANTLLSYQLLPGLVIKSTFGYTNLQSNELVVLPLTAQAPQNRPFSQRVGFYTFNNINSWIIEPQVTYKSTIAKGTLDALIGSTIEQNNSNGQQLSATGFTSDAVIPDMQAAATVTAGTTTVATYKYNALFGRIGYNWGNRYLLNLTGRLDGSSRFGSSNQFHDFGAIGAGWIFSDTRLIKRQSLISFGKFRASYGTTGNDQIGDYQYLTTYSSTINASVPYQGVVGLQPTGLSNPNLQWEETRKMELGMDLGAIKDRVLVNTAYFRNRTSNELLSYSLPATTGFGGISENFPATVQNSGWQISVHTVNVKNRNFSWTTFLNLTIPGNKLVSFPTLSTSSYASRLVVNKPINILKAFHLLGVNDTTGIYQFEDSKGSANYNPTYGTDNNTIISLDPKMYGGLQNDLQYQHFSLSFLFSFTKQTASNYLFGTSLPGYEGTNEPTWTLNRWKNAGDHAFFEKYNSTGSLFYPAYFDATISDAAYSDATFFRLRNVVLSWQFPNVWMRKAGIRNAKVFLQGQNLLTITKYEGLDPESRSSTSLPPLRVITFGFQCSL